MDILLLYLFTRADAIQIVMVIATTACFSCALFLTMCAMHHNDYPAEPEKAQQCKQSRPPYLIWGGIFAFLAVLAPSKQDIAIIVGGHLVYEGVTSESFLKGADETSSKIYKIMQRHLDEALEDDSEEPEEEE